MFFHVARSFALISILQLTFAEPVLATYRFLIQDNEGYDRIAFTPDTVAVSQNKYGEHEIDLSAFIGPKHDDQMQITFQKDDVTVGEMTVLGGHITFSGESKQRFSFSGLSHGLASFDVNIPGGFKVTEAMSVEHFVRANSNGSATFFKDMKVGSDDDKGKAFICFMKSTGQYNLNGKTTSDQFIIEDGVKVMNRGSLTVDQLVFQKAASYQNRGHVLVREIMQGDVNAYQEAGRLTSLGFMGIITDSAQITDEGEIYGRVIQISSATCLDTINGSSIEVQDSLTLSSKGDLQHLGKIAQKTSHNWPSTAVYSDELKGLLAAQRRGIYLLADGDITRKGSITPTNTPIQMAAKGDVHDSEDLLQSGFMPDNDVFISAVNAKLEAAIRSSANIIVSSDKATLAGKTVAQKTIQIKTKTDLTQTPKSELRSDVVIADVGGNADLAGKTHATDVHARVAKTLSTASTGHIESQSVSAQAKDATFDGRFEGQKTLVVRTKKTTTYGPTFSTNAENRDLQAGKQKHLSGSKFERKKGQHLEMGDDLLSLAEDAVIENEVVALRTGMSGSHSKNCIQQFFLAKAIAKKIFKMSDQDIEDYTVLAWQDIGTYIIDGSEIVLNPFRWFEKLFEWGEGKMKKGTFRRKAMEKAVWLFHKLAKVFDIINPLHDIRWLAEKIEGTLHPDRIVGPKHLMHIKGHVDGKHVSLEGKHMRLLPSGHVHADANATFDFKTFLAHGAKVRAEADINLRGSWWTSLIAGTHVTAKENMVIDTRGFLTIAGASLVNADNTMRIYADMATLLGLAVVNADHLKINTGLMANGLGIVRGKRDLTLNALVNIQAGVQLSNAGNVNSLISFCPGGLGALTLPASVNPIDWAYDSEKEWYEQPGLHFTRDVAVMIVSKVFTLGALDQVLQWTRLASSIASLGRGTYQFATGLHAAHQNDGEFWRLSHLLENTMPLVSLAAQGVGIGKQISRLKLPTMAGLKQVGVQDNINCWDIFVRTAGMVGGQSSSNSIFSYKGQYYVDLAFGTHTDTSIWNIHHGYRFGLVTKTNAVYSTDTSSGYVGYHSTNTLRHHVEGGKTHALAGYDVKAGSLEEEDDLEIYSLGHVGLMASGRHDWNPNVIVHSWDFSVGGEFYVEGEKVDVLNDLYQQVGVFENVEAKGHVTGVSHGEEWKLRKIRPVIGYKRNGDPIYGKAEDPKCASESFSATADDIDIGSDMNVTTKENLSITATEGKITIAAGTEIGGCNGSTNLSALKGDVIAKTEIRNNGKSGKKYREYVTGVNVIGQRTAGNPNGIFIYAGHKVLMDAAHFVSSNGGDIFIIGDDGVAINVREHKYTGEKDYIWEHRPKLFSYRRGEFHTTGQVHFQSKNGKVSLNGAYVKASGGSAYGDQGVSTSSTVTRIKQQKLFGSETKDIETEFTFENIGDKPFVIMAPNGDIIAIGFVYTGLDSALIMDAQNIHLGARVLKHKGWGIKHSISTNQDENVKAMIMAALGNMSEDDLKALLLQHGYKAVNPQNIADMVGKLNEGDIKGLLPTLQVNADTRIGRFSHEIQGAGSIEAGFVSLNAKNAIHQTGGYRILCGGANISAQEFFQQGAELTNTDAGVTVGTHATITAEGDVGVGVHAGADSTKSRTYVNSSINCFGNLLINVDELNQNAGHIRAATVSGQVGKIYSVTRQDKYRSSGFNASVTWHGGYDFSGSASAHHQESRYHNQRSGIFAEGAGIGGFTLGGGHLRGARVDIADPSNACIGELSYQSLGREYRNRGGSFGFAFSHNVPTSISLGASDGNHSVNVSFDISKRDQSGSLFKSLGNVTYENRKGHYTVGAPLAYNVNADAWKQFGSDLKGVSQSAWEGLKTAGHFVYDHSVLNNFGRETLDTHYSQPVEPVSQPANDSYFTTLSAMETADPDLVNAVYEPIVESELERTLREAMAWLDITPYEASEVSEDDEFEDEQPREESESTLFDQVEDFLLSYATTSPDDAVKLTSKFLKFGRYFAPFGRVNWLDSSNAANALPASPLIEDVVSTLHKPLTFSAFEGTYQMPYRLGKQWYMTDPLLGSHAREISTFLASHESPIVRKAYQTIMKYDLDILLFDTTNLPGRHSPKGFWAEILADTRREVIASAFYKDIADVSGNIVHEATHKLLSRLPAGWKDTFIDTYNHELKTLDTGGHLTFKQGQHLYNYSLYHEKQFAEEALCHLAQLEAMDPTWSTAHKMPLTYKVMQKLNLVEQPSVMGKIWSSTKRGLQATQPYAVAGLTALDFALHCYEAQTVPLGVQRTLVDMGVYGACFESIGKVGGNTLKWGALAASIGAGFIPEYDPLKAFAADQRFRDLHGYDARKIGLMNPSEFYQHIQTAKDLMILPAHLALGVNHLLETKAPWAHRGVSYLLNNPEIITLVQVARGHSPIGIATSIAGSYFRRTGQLLTAHPEISYDVSSHPEIERSKRKGKWDDMGLLSKIIASETLGDMSPGAMRLLDTAHAQRDHEMLEEFYRHIANIQQLLETPLPKGLWEQ